MHIDACDHDVVRVTGAVGRLCSPCFAPGTRIRTVDGPVAVDALRPGMQVLTADHGAQGLRWIGVRKVDFGREPDRLRPVCIAAGAFGRGRDGTPVPERDLVVSPRHRMVIDGPGVAQLCGVSQALAPAAGLTSLPGVRVLRATRTVTYHALLFDRHEVIYAEGTATESFRPGEIALADFPPLVRSEVYALYPALEDDAAAALGPPARPILSLSETQAVLEAAAAGRPLAPLIYRSRPFGAAAARYDEDIW